MNADQNIAPGLDLNPPVHREKGINPAVAEKYAGKRVCVIGAMHRGRPFRCRW